MSVSFLGVGSFLTWNVALYLVIIIVETILSKNISSIIKNLKIIVSFASLSIFMGIVSLINGVSIFKIGSTLAYWALPTAFILDKKSIKKPEVLALSFAFSIFISNLFAFSFIYILKKPIEFFSQYIPGAIQQFQFYGENNYRYAGLPGDANHNGFNIVVSIILLIYCCTKSKRNIPFAIILGLPLIVFGLIGGSKAFAVLLALGIIILFGIFIRKTKYKIFAILVSTFLICLGFVLILSVEAFSKTVLRFFSSDYREGFLEAVTTLRASIWSTQISELMKNPINFAFGNGFWATDEFGSASHNAYLQSLLNLGMIGTMLYILYVKNFVLKNKKNFIAIAFILSFLIMSLSLHIIYDEIITISFFIIYKISCENNNANFEISI